MQLIDSEYPCEKSFYDVVYEYLNVEFYEDIPNLVLEHEDITAPICLEEQVHVDFIIEGTQKQGVGELVDIQRIAEVLKEIEEVEIMEIYSSHNDKEERFIVNQKVFSHICNDHVTTYLKTSNNVSLALF